MGDLHIVTQGPRDAPALLLIHAMGTDSRFWDECVAQWRERYFCVAPDLRSAGLSPLADPPAGVAQHAEDMEALRRKLGVARWVVIGCAMGGAVGAGLAARHPGSVAGLVMANPGLRNSDETKALLRARVDLVRREGMAALLPAAAERAFHNLPRDARFARYAGRYAEQRAEGYARQVLGFLDVDIEADVAALRCPLLVTPGAHDILMPADSAARIAEVQPCAEVEMLPGGHFVPMQAPDAFVARVDRFLSRIAGYGDP